MKQFVLFFLITLVLMPTSAARPMTSLFAKNLDASMLEIGFLTACYSVVPLILAMAMGRLIDRLGEKIPLIIGSVGITLSLLLLFFCPILPTMYLSQLIMGGSQLFSLVAIQNSLARSTSSVGRDKAMGNLSLFASIGLLLGPLVGGYLSENYGFQLTYLLITPLSILCIIVSFIGLSSKEKVSNSSSEKTERKNSLLSLPGLRRPIIISMLCMAVADLFYAYFPLFASSIGLSPSQIGWIFAIQGTTSALARVFMPRLVENYGRTRTLWVFMSIGALAYGSLPFLHQYHFIFIISAILGAGLGVAQPLTLILSYNSAPKGRTGEALALRLPANRLAQVTLPFLFAGISSLIGLGAIFVVKALVLGFGAWMASGIPSKDGDRPVVQKREDLGG